MLYWLWRLFEVTLYCHVEGQKNYPIVFGQLTNKDGSMLVGREPEPDFKWENLRGKPVLAGRPGGVPAMMLQYICNSAGLTDSDVNLDTSVEFNAMVGTFDADKQYDYCTMFEPTASDFVAAGKGHIVASVGAAGGEVPYTVFAASKSYLENKRDVAEAFLRAVFKGYKYLTEHTPEDVAKKLTASFIETSEASIAAALKNYLEIDAFARTPILKEKDFEHFMDIMENAGTLASRVSFSKAVDNSIAAKVAA